MDLDHDVMKLAKMPAHATDGLFPIFHYETRLDDEATQEAGQNVYKKVPYVEIIAPGNDKERINRRVKQSDKERWPEQWRAFEAGNTEVEFDGMPITEWPPCDRHLAMTLNSANIYTVEQLSEVPDVDIQMLGPGMMTLKSKARTWVKEKLGRDEEIEELKRKLEALENRETGLEVVIKNGSWYKYRGANYHKGDLPEHVVAALEESGE